MKVIFMDKLNILVANDDGINAIGIKILANAGYNTFIFFDDNEGNLQSAKKLESEYHITAKTVKV